MPERDFLIFGFFQLFFSNFLARVGYEQNLGLKFFSLCLGLSHPVLAKNNAGKRFFNFLNFFAIFFEFFFPRPSMNGNRDKISFFSFSAYLLPFWLKITPERDFLIFCFLFFYFFRNFLSWAEYERNSGQTFFSLFPGQSHPVLPKYNTGKRFFNFFAIFF